MARAEENTIRDLSFYESRGDAKKECVPYRFSLKDAPKRADN
jgi:hypothetical protein